MGRVLISGGAGFLGSHLCDRLLAEGHRVIAVDSLITGRVENIAHLRERADFQFVERDVAAGALDVAGTLDYILHMASPASPPEYARLPIETLKAGSFATHALLELARETGARFLLASTSEVYGDPPAEEHPQRESYWGNVNSVGRRSVYDEAKRYAEAATMAYHREFGVDTRIVRIFNTYGPRMRSDDGRVVTNFIMQALRGAPITVYGGGEQTRSFCYVSDLVDGIYRLLMSNETMPVNIGNPNELTVRELAVVVLELIGGDSALVDAALLFDDDPKQRRPDISKARLVLGWEPVVPLREGLAETIAYLRSELER